MGTTALVASTGTSASVPYPTDIAVGDLLLLGCQGRNNSMNWTATGFDTLVAPAGPSGLRFELLSRWATGGESGTLTVASTTGINGWSCSLTAMRGGIGSGDPLAAAIVTQTGTSRGMVAPAVPTVPEGALVTRWFASSDDNSHGTPSEGILAFGGTGYHTVTGVDHGSSMSYAVQTAAGTRGTASMQQNLNFADPSVAVSVVLRP